VIVYTNLMPARFAGYTIGPVILIRPSHKDDTGLIAHERVHVAQFWRRPVLHGLLYRLSKRYRLDCEVRAYAVQCLDPVKPITVTAAAERIASHYGLGIGSAEAWFVLKQRIGAIKREGV
jgi:hypothetical protein